MYGKVDVEWLSLVCSQGSCISGAFAAGRLCCIADISGVFSCRGSLILLSLFNNRSGKNCNVGSPAAVNNTDSFHSDAVKTSQTRAIEKILPICIAYACRYSFSLFSIQGDILTEL